MSDLVDTVAEVMSRHQWSFTAGIDGWDCSCGVSFGPHFMWDIYREHVAHAIVGVIDRG